MDRKEEIRRYQETPRPAGIYRVTHVASGRTMVGTSPDAPARLRRIQTQLELGSHPSRGLQDDWDANGQAGFQFEVLDLLPPPKDQNVDIESELESLLELWAEKLGIDPTAPY